MFNTLKRAVATLASVAILASTGTGVAFAQTFNDVPTDAWYFDFVEQLVDDGVISKKDNYNPSATLNRAELVKMVIEAIDGKSGTDLPDVPTFTDVSKDAWYFEYVEPAVQLNIVEGYKDAQGNLTGLFGPSDTVNRAQAIKVLVEAFGISEDTRELKSFPDVPSDAWFAGYVQTAYNQSILDGYPDGTFRPGVPVNRAEIAKLIINAQDPVAKPDPNPNPTPDPTPDPTPNPNPNTGDLEVSLNSKTARGATVPRKANSVDLLSIDFTAADGDTTIKELIVTRGGVGDVTDFDQIYAYKGNERLTTGRSINNDTNTVTLNLNLDIEAGNTETIRIVGDVADANSAKATNQHFFFIASAADVNAEADTVAGDFPVTGDTFTIGNVDVTDVTISAGSVPSRPQVGGKDQEVAAFRLAAGAENDVALSQIALTQNGSLNSDRLVNCRLLRGTDEVATAAGFVSDVITFVLGTPYVIDEGQTKNFFVNCDIEGGRPDDDTVQLYVDEDTDILAIDQQYGFGAGVVNQYDTAQSTAIILEGSGVTIVDNGPAARQVAQNSDNVVIFNFSITADRDLDVRDMDLTIRTRVGADITDVPNAVANNGFATVGGSNNNLRSGFRTDTDIAANLARGDVIKTTINGTTYHCAVTNDPADTTTGAGGADTTTDCPSIAVANTDTFEFGIDPYEFIENVKIVDTDKDSTLQGPVTRWNATTTKSGVANTEYSKTFNEDYSLIGGETRNLAVVVDLNQNMPSGLEIEAEFDFDKDGYIKDINANKNVSLNDIVGAKQTSKRHTVKQDSIDVAKTSNVISQEFVKGSKSVACGQFAFTAGDAGDIVLKKIAVRAYGDDDGDFDNGGTNGLGDTQAKEFVSSLSLYDGNTLVAGPESLELIDNGAAGFTPGTDYNRALFDDLNIVVEDGQTKNLTVRADFLSNFSANQRFLACDILPSADITAEDNDDADTITAGSTNPTNAAGNLVLATTPNPLITLIQNGTLTATSTSNSIAPTVLVGGTNDVLVAQYTFTAEKEAFDVNKLTIINDDGVTTQFDAPEDTNAVQNVKITFPDINGTERSAEGPLTNGTRTFSGLDFHVPRDKSVTLKIFADATAIQSGTFTVSGKKVKIGLQEGATNNSSTFEAVGSSSSTTLNFNNAADVKSSSNIATHVVRKAKPVFAKATQGTSAMPTNDEDIFRFNVTAQGGDISIARFVFDITTSGLNTPGNDISNFDFRNSSGAVEGVNIVATNAAGANPINVEDAPAGSGLEDADGVDNDGISNLTGYKLVVTFDDEQIISQGITEIFSIRATVTGADSLDTLTVKLSPLDEEVEVAGILAAFDNDNVKGAGAGTFANTAQIFGGAPNQGLFATEADFYRGSAVAGRNFIWSDRAGGDVPGAGGNATSAVHTYAGVVDLGLAPTTTGVIGADTGTVDFTNGFNLKIDEVGSFGFRK